MDGARCVTKEAAGMYVKEVGSVSLLLPSSVCTREGTPPVVQGWTFRLPVSVTLTHGRLASWFVKKVDIQVWLLFSRNNLGACAIVQCFSLGIFENFLCQDTDLCPL